MQRVCATSIGQNRETLTDVEEAICKAIARSLSDSRDKIREELIFCKKSNVYPKIFAGLRTERDYKFSLRETPVRIGELIELNSTEKNLVCSVAPERTKASRKASLINMRQDKSRGDKDVEIEGLAGELAYCKGHNIYPYEQLCIVARKSHEDCGDAIHQNGRTVDVKTTAYPNGRLAQKNWKSSNFNFSLFALMTGSVEKGLVFRGFNTVEDQLRQERLRCLPNTFTQQFIAEQKELKPYQEVFGND